MVNHRGGVSKVKCVPSRYSAASPFLTPTNAVRSERPFCPRPTPVTYLYTYSMEQSPSWEGNRFSLFKKFPAFYRTRRFIPAVASARHLSLSWARSIQPIPPHPTSWRSILILFPISVWFSQVDSFPQVSPPKPCLRLSSQTYALHASPTSFLSNLAPEKCWVRSADH